MSKLEVNVDDSESVIRYSQLKLIEVVEDTTTENKDKVSALKALSSTAINVSRLSLANDQQKVNAMLAEAIAKISNTLDPYSDSTEVRTRPIEVDIPAVMPLLGEDSLENKEIAYTDVIKAV